MLCTSLRWWKNGGIFLLKVMKQVVELSTHKRIDLVCSHTYSLKFGPVFGKDVFSRESYRGKTDNACGSINNWYTASDNVSYFGLSPILLCRYFRHSYGPGQIPSPKLQGAPINREKPAGTGACSALLNITKDQKQVALNKYSYTMIEELRVFKKHPIYKSPFFALSKHF